MRYGLWYGKLLYCTGMRFILSGLAGGAGLPTFAILESCQNQGISHPHVFGALTAGTKPRKRKSSLNFQDRSVIKTIDDEKHCKVHQRADPRQNQSHNKGHIEKSHQGKEGKSHNQR